MSAGIHEEDFPQSEFGPKPTPTAPLTTAAEMAREFFRIDPDAALTPTVERCIAELATLLTTYAAQVRREALEEAISDMETLKRSVATRRNGKVENDAVADSAIVGIDGAIDICRVLRSLPPGSPSSQTDTGDSANE